MKQLFSSPWSLCLAHRRLEGQSLTVVPLVVSIPFLLSGKCARPRLSQRRVYCVPPNQPQTAPTAEWVKMGNGDPHCPFSSSCCLAILFYSSLLNFILATLGLCCGGQASRVMVCRLSCPAARGILVPWQGTEPVTPALEGGPLTTGPLRKSLSGCHWTRVSGKPQPKSSWRDHMNKYYCAPGAAALSWELFLFGVLLLWCKKHNGK